MKVKQLHEVYLYSTYQKYESKADTKKKITALLNQEKKKVDGRVRRVSRALERAQKNHEASKKRTRHSPRRTQKASQGKSNVQTIKLLQVSLRNVLQDRKETESIAAKLKNEWNVLVRQIKQFLRKYRKTTCPSLSWERMPYIIRPRAFTTPNVRRLSTFLVNARTTRKMKLAKYMKSHRMTRAGKASLIESKGQRQVKRAMQLIKRKREVKRQNENTLRENRRIRREYLRNRKRQDHKLLATKSLIGF